MRKSLWIRTLMLLLVLMASVFAHVAAAQDVFASGSDTSSSDTDQGQDQGDVFSADPDDGSTQPIPGPTLGDVFSSLGSDKGSNPAPNTSDPMPTNPFFGMEFKLLAEVVELEEQKPASNQSGLPLPPNVRGQLLQAAARLDSAATNGQNYSLAATNRFFHCMGEAVSADLRFLAQPGYVPAAQIARSLHEGVWKYLTSNAYDNNLAMYDAAVQSMQHAMNDPACFLGQAAPGILAVAATHTAGAMAEARQISQAANAAIALEETAEANGYAKWYVPGLRCEGCLVYGTAEGDYVNFARTVGGRTINSIPKPVELNWNQFSAKVLNSALQTRTPVLFSLQGMEQLDQVLAGQAYTKAVTSFELRYIQQNWGQFKSIVRFYNNGAQVPAPWE
jgi:hypothetical protein